MRTADCTFADSAGTFTKRQNLSRMFAMAFAVSAAMLSTAIPASATTFSDLFDRPNGTVGNGWTDTSGNNAGSLVLRKKALSTLDNGCRDGIYRPIGYAGNVTLSAPITQENGFGGLLERYETQFIFRNDGTVSGGYSVSFYRGDQTFTDSTVELLVNGVLVDSVPSSFQYGPMIFVKATLFPDGRVKGRVSDGTDEFQFSFPRRDISGLTGTNIAIVQDCPDTRSNVITYPTINRFSVDYTGTD
jgi:hypothetical protein